MPTLVFSGGLNEQDVALVRPEECIEGYNYELSYGGTSFKSRLPFDTLGTATNASDVSGIIQLIKTDDSETTLIQAGATVYNWDGADTFSSVGTVNATSKLRGTTWSLDDYSVITDIEKQTVVKQWDATTFSDLTTGLGTSLYAKYGLAHLGRMWLFNVKTSSDTPHLLVASAFEDAESYDTSKRSKDATFSTGNEAFYMTSPDLLPINGAVLWQDILIMSTENGRLWKLTGSDSTDFEWVPFYTGSAASGDETMSNIGDDVAYMKRNGVIESLRATEKYGDVATDDLSRWIRSTSAGINDCITVYDQSRQKVYFFAGSNKLLVLFKDLLNSEVSPWGLYKTTHSSAFSTNVAQYIREPGGTSASAWYVYYGGVDGKVYRLDGTGSNGDNGDTDIECTRKTTLLQNLLNDDGSPISLENDRIRGRVYYRRLISVSLFMQFEWADDYGQTVCSVPLEGLGSLDDAQYFGGSAYFGGEYYFNSGFVLSYRTSTKGFSPVGRGPGLYLLTSITASRQFDVLKITI